MRIIIALVYILFSLSLTAQKKNNSKDEIRLFLDCYNCDISYIKTEINYIDFVEDRFSANLYVLSTSQSTGSGGEQVTFFFNGQENFEGMNDTFKFFRTSIETDDEFRIKGVRFLKMGLMRFVAKTSINQKIEISLKNDSTEDQLSLNSTENKKDKWNYWVFNTSVSGSYNTNDIYKSHNFSGSFQASRVTEKMKVFFNANIRSSQQSYTLNGIENKYPNSNHGFYTSAVKSINNHWSIGGYANYRYSTYNNFKKNITVTPAVEFSFFKYAASVKKSITLFYLVGPNYSEYIDSGYYDRPEHVNYLHALLFNMSFTEKWGSLNFNSSFTNFLNSFYLNDNRIKGKNVNKFSSGLYLNVRIVKGLSAYVSCAADFNKGINPGIPRTDFTIDQLLTNSRQYPTNKSFYTGLGLSYRFGSIYNNVVNPRFENSNY